MPGPLPPERKNGTAESSRAEKYWNNPSAWWDSSTISRGCSFGRADGDGWDMCCWINDWVGGKKVFALGVENPIASVFASPRLASSSNRRDGDAAPISV